MYQFLKYINDALFLFPKKYYKVKMLSLCAASCILA